MHRSIKGMISRHTELKSGTRQTTMEWDDQYASNQAQKM